MNHEPKAQAGSVNITKYVKVATGKGEGWCFCPVVRSSNGRIRADYVWSMEERSFTRKALTTSSGIRRELVAKLAEQTGGKAVRIVVPELSEMCHLPRLRRA